jgi:hypothetical protein
MDYYIDAYEGSEMSDHISNLQARMVVFTSEVRLALQREEAREADDSEVGEEVDVGDSDEYENESESDD